MPKAVKASVGNNKKIIHPNSRKASQLARQAHHDQKLGRLKQEREKKLKNLGEKFKYFQDQLEEGKSDYTKRDVLEILESYFHRFDEELEQISIVNSVGGRQGIRHASRIDSIKMTLHAEKAEFESMGIDVPDLLNKKNLEAFRNWNGELRLMQNFKFRKVSLRDKQTVENADATSEDKTSVDGNSHDKNGVENSSKAELSPYPEEEESDVNDSVSKDLSNG